MSDCRLLSSFRLKTLIVAGVAINIFSPLSLNGGKISWYTRKRSNLIKIEIAISLIKKEKEKELSNISNFFCDIQSIPNVIWIPKSRKTKKTELYNYFQRINNSELLHNIYFINTTDIFYSYFISNFYATRHKIVQSIFFKFFL